MTPFSVGIVNVLISSAISFKSNLSAVTPFGGFINFILIYASEKTDKLLTTFFKLFAALRILLAISTNFLRLLSLASSPSFNKGEASQLKSPLSTVNSSSPFCMIVL